MLPAGAFILADSRRAFDTMYYDVPKVVWNRCAAFKTVTNYFVEEREPSEYLLPIVFTRAENFIGCPVGTIEIYDYFNPIYNHSEIK